MKTLEERRQRLSLTLLFSGLVFLFLLATMIFVALIILLLVHLGRLQMGEGELRTGTFILIIALTSILIGTGLSATVGRYPLRPLNNIINAMNRLAAGDFQARLTFQGPLSRLPVVQEVEDSFNKMASELENTELLRSDFINNFSHEFKTPIVSITGFAKLLKRGNLTEERKTECLNIIEEESLRLSQMATNVLNLTKVENQTILTDVGEYNLSEQIRTCVLMLEGKWSKKHIELSLPEKEYFVSANEELMKQVWINLIDNAIKFSPDFETVEIGIIRECGSLSVTVSNVGEEIPEDKREKIFNKFYQADESHATEGNGLGLAVVKRIADLHGGSVGVSCAEGKTTFTVALPCNK